MVLIQIQSYKNPDEIDKYMVYPYSTIGELREEIAEAEGKDLSKIKLYFNDKLLDDNEQTITEAGLVYGVLLKTSLRPSTPAPAPVPAPPEPAGEPVDGDNNG